jgi:peptidoglycan/LPS O-acetylase OafA/YrhL
VVVFFVLSGFVISYSQRNKEPTAASFALARAARILSVTAPALVLTVCLDHLGYWLHPSYYVAMSGYDPAGGLLPFALAQVFMTEVWGLHISPGTDFPYWSVSYEVWCYVFFAMAVFVPKLWRILAVLAAMAVAGPGIVAMFPLWLIGYGCYRICERGGVSRGLGIVLFVGSFAVWAGFESDAGFSKSLILDLGPTFSRLEFVRDYVIAILFGAHIVGFHAICRRAELLCRLTAGPVRWIAGATFSLYLYHLPIAQFLTTIIPWAPESWAGRTAIIGGSLTAIFALAACTERRKTTVKRWILAIGRWASYHLRQASRSAGAVRHRRLTSSRP